MSWDWVKATMPSLLFLAVCSGPDKTGWYMEKEHQSGCKCGRGANGLHDCICKINLVILYPWFTVRRYIHTLPSQVLRSLTPSLLVCLTLTYVAASRPPNQIIILIILYLTRLTYIISE